MAECVLRKGFNLHWQARARARALSITCQIWLAHVRSMRDAAHLRHQGSQGDGVHSVSIVNTISIALANHWRSIDDNQLLEVLTA